MVGLSLVLDHIHTVVHLTQIFLHVLHTHLHIKQVLVIVIQQEILLVWSVYQLQV